MTKQGWIALHRQIQDHWLWEDKPFSKQAAWIDMLLLANHEDNKFLLGNEVVTVKCGSFITSIEKLKNRWGWSNTKVINFLKTLENDEMVTRKSDTKKTVITLINYGVYSNFGKTKTMPKRCENDTETMPKHTNNNDNNYNNDNNVIKKERKKKDSGYDVILSKIDDESLRETYLEYIKMRKMIKAPMTDRALTTLINKVENLEPFSIARQKKMLETAIMNNWKSVYPLKADEVPETKGSYYSDLFKKRIFTGDDEDAS